MQLSNIYCIKSYLVNNLPVMAAQASFIDLKHAIMESVDEIKIQLLRMDEIYNIIGEQYHPQQCIGIKAFTTEAYGEIKTPGLSPLESDLMMLYFLNSLESIEISCYTALHDMALSMPQDDLSLLLKQNLDMAVDSKELYQMITREYIN